jgi:hypothetical protein
MPRLEVFIKSQVIFKWLANNQQNKLTINLKNVLNQSFIKIEEISIINI